MVRRHLLLLLSMVCTLACSGCATVSTERGLVIAHRGASGYLPEHTLAAYALAHAQGTDLIEPDVVLTRDSVLICRHDTIADETTNVAEVFPGRARADGHWYFADLSLAEVKMLEARGRDGTGRGHTVPTLDEMSLLVRTLNQRTSRSVGLIPEPKRPAWHAEQGLSMLGAVESALREPGLEGLEGVVIVQCFEMDFLLELRERGWQTPMVWLVGDPVADAQLEQAAGANLALGPARRLLIDDDTGARTDLWERASRLGLGLYPYTFKDEPAEMGWYLRQRGVAGVFTDFPDVGARAR